MRKTLTYNCTQNNRDQGKVFLITEMSADATEQWAMQAFFALMNAGVDIPDDIAAMGFAGIVQLGLGALGRVPYGAVKPLFDSMMECVQIIPNPAQPNVVRALIDTDIEEVTTRIALRKAIFELHVSGLKTDAP
jgi:hypothetical protein